MVTIDDMTAGPIPIRDLINSTRPCTFNEFKSFLKMLEVYGSGYEYFDELQDQPDSKPPRKKSLDKDEGTTTVYEDKAIQALKEVVEVLEYLESKSSSSNQDSKQESVEGMILNLIQFLR